MCITFFYLADGKSSPLAPNGYDESAFCDLQSPKSSPDAYNLILAFPRKTSLACRDATLGFDPELTSTDSKSNSNKIKITAPIDLQINNGGTYIATSQRRFAILTNVRRGNKSFFNLRGFRRKFLLG